MSENNNNVSYDVNGYDEVTAALRSLINSYTGLAEGEKITFSSLPEDGGKSWYPLSGAIVEREMKSITGNVFQICGYPFQVIFRVAGSTENRKANIKESLDAFGVWLEKITDFPALTGGREFTEIRRTTPAYLANAYENGIEDWEMAVVARYSNFYRIGDNDG